MVSVLIAYHYVFGKSHRDYRFFMPAAILGSFFYCYLENEKVTLLTLNQRNFDAPAKINPEEEQVIEWWFENTDSIEKPVALPAIDLEYFCNLSL